VDAQNPCLTCGACCAAFRISLDRAEADDAGGTVPVDMTWRFDDLSRVMKMAERAEPRCVALEGTIGSCVRCTIYEGRPSACREFAVSWENGKPNELCDRARKEWGLEPLSPPNMKEKS